MEVMKKALVKYSVDQANEHFPKVFIGEDGSHRIVSSGEPLVFNEGETYFLEPAVAGFATDYTKIYARAEHGSIVVYQDGEVVKVALFNTTTGSRLDYNFMYEGDTPVLKDGISAYVHKSFKQIFEDNDLRPMTYYTGVVDMGDFFLYSNWPVSAIDKKTGEIMWFKDDWYDNGDPNDELGGDPVYIDKDKIWALNRNNGISTLHLVHNVRTGEFVTISFEDKWFNEMIALPDGSVVLLEYDEPDGDVARVAWDGSQFVVDHDYAPDGLYVYWGMSIMCNVKFSPDGQRFYITTYEDIRAYSVDDGRRLWIYDNNGEYRSSETIAVNPITGNLYTHYENPENWRNADIHEIDGVTGELIKVVTVENIDTMDNAAMSHDGILFIQGNNEDNFAFIDVMSDPWDITLVMNEDTITQIPYMALPVVTKDAAYFPANNGSIVAADFRNRTVYYLPTTDLPGGQTIYSHGMLAADNDGVLFYSDNMAGIIKVTDKYPGSEWVPFGVVKPLPDDIEPGFYTVFDEEWSPPLENVYDKAMGIVPMSDVPSEENPVYSFGRDYSVSGNTYFTYKMVEGLAEQVGGFTTPGSIGTVMGKWQSPHKFVAMRSGQHTLQPYLIDALEGTVENLPTLVGTGNPSLLFGMEAPNGDFVIVSARANVSTLYTHKLTPGATSMSTHSTYQFPVSDTPGASMSMLLYGAYAKGKFYIFGRHEYWVTSEERRSRNSVILTYDPIADAWETVYYDEVEPEGFSYQSSPVVHGDYIYIGLSAGTRFNTLTNQFEPLPGRPIGTTRPVTGDKSYLDVTGRVIYMVGAGGLNNRLINAAYVIGEQP